MNLDVFDDITEILFFTQQAADMNEHACEAIIPIIITEKEIDVIPVIDAAPRKDTRADGIICIKPNLALTIEVKKYSGVDWSQVYGHVNLFNDDTLERLDAINLTWDEIVKLLNKSISYHKNLFGASENYLSGLENSLINDFIEYVGEYHPHLMPYDKLEYCRENRIAYQKFITHIMPKLDLGNPKENFVEFTDKKILNWVKRVYLTIDGELKNFSIELFPGDTTHQAINFYENCSLDKLEELLNDRWVIGPNLHFSFISTHLHKIVSDMEVTDYIKYWQSNISDIRQYKRDEYGSLYEKLLSKNLIREADVEDLRTHFDNTTRNHINLAPGLAFSYKLPLREALELERKSLLISSIRETASKAINIM